MFQLGRAGQAGVHGVLRNMKVLALLLIGVTLALAALSCGRSCLCIGPSRRVGLALSGDQALDEVAALARETAPLHRLVWRENTRTGWLFAWTEGGRDEIKAAVRANPNLQLLQVERSIFPLDDLTMLFNPQMRTVRCMGLGRAGGSSPGESFSARD